MSRFDLVLPALLLPLSAVAGETGLAYLLDQPLPVLAGAADPGFAEDIAIGASFHGFDNAGQVLQAFARGEIVLATGLEPEVLLAGLARGLPLQLVDVPVLRRSFGSCYLSPAIAGTGAALFGLRAALPRGTGLDRLLAQEIEVLGGDPASMIRVDRASPDAAAALARGDVQIACASGSGLARLAEHGAPLLPQDEADALALGWPLVTLADARAAADNPGMIRAFVAAGRTSGDLAAIAAAAGMNGLDAEAALSVQTIPDAALKAALFAGPLADHLGALADLSGAALEPETIASAIDGRYLGE